ncbi:hypothetical protein CDAR_50331 [Caerostris darwini]|uniref:Uncharacterized protein n=1 Tax=Caerostris darwini TaxID=1538125 RepID=A0AAV4UWS0_9ARAC|nr:hypothetical protein CDAR_50331 [Caerostris darwini]
MLKMERVRKIVPKSLSVDIRAEDVESEPQNLSFMVSNVVQVMKWLSFQDCSYTPSPQIPPTPEVPVSSDILTPFLLQEEMSLGSDDVQQSSRQMQQDTIDIVVRVDEPEILVLSHKPQYMGVELFSYVGGFMGCWLGLSVWALVDVLEGLLRKGIRYKKTFPVRQNSKNEYS